MTDSDYSFMKGVLRNVLATGAWMSVDAILDAASQRFGCDPGEVARVLRDLGGDVRPVPKPRVLHEYRLCPEARA